MDTLFVPFFSFYCFICCGCCWFCSEPWIYTLITPKLSLFIWIVFVNLLTMLYVLNDNNIYDHYMHMPNGDMFMNHCGKSHSFCMNLLHELEKLSEEWNVLFHFLFVFVYLNIFNGDFFFSSSFVQSNEIEHFKLMFSCFRLKSGWKLWLEIKWLMYKTFFFLTIFSDIEINECLSLSLSRSCYYRNNTVLSKSIRPYVYSMNFIHYFR